MSTQYKTLNLPFLSGMKEFEQFQDMSIRNWHNSVDSAFSSISHFFNFSNKALNELNRNQRESLNAFFEANREFTTHKSSSREDSALVSDKKVTTGVALVTGGIGGIGTAICKRLAEDNAKIIATYISFEKDNALSWQKERLAEGLDVELYECDVSDFEACKQMAQRIEKEIGRLDVLVNCAGITRDAMLKKLEPENWDAVIDTNLDSVFNVTRNFIDTMIKRNYGRIINISSVNGQKGQFGQTNYSSAKAGMIGFSRALAIELADKGITVNCVCPGYVGTSMVEAIPDHIKQAIISQIPCGRLATPAEIADAVGFLASPESAYITGTELAVNGGLFTG